MVTQTTDEIKQGSTNDKHRIVKQFKDLDQMMTGVTDQLGSSSLPIGLLSASKEKLEKVSAGTAESRKKSSVS